MERLCRVYENPDIIREVREGKYPFDKAIRDIRTAYPLLLRSELIETESHQERYNRLTYEGLQRQGGNFNYESLPLPYGSGSDITFEFLQTLEPQQYRRGLRAVCMIHQKAYSRNPKIAILFFWWFGISCMLQGDSHLISNANYMGLCPSFETLRRFRRQTASTNKITPMHKKLKDNLLLQTAFDNIDSEKTRNNPHATGDSYGYHGTIVVGIQTSDSAPIFPRSLHSRLLKSIYPTPADMLKSTRVFDESTTCCSEAIVCGLIWHFRRNLISCDRNERVSLGYVLKMALENKSSDVPSTFENLMFLRQNSNSDETACTIMRSITACARELYRGLEGRNMFIPITADNPLYLRMIRAIHNAIPGTRNPDYSHIIPQMGLMHATMAMMDAAKYICYDALFDGLMPFAGISPGAQSAFRKSKDFKTNLRFFTQVLSATTIRITEELIEEGEIDAVHTNFGRGGTMEAMDLELLSYASNEDERYDAWFTVKVNRKYFPPRLACLGDKIASAI